jgi:hypothetical protein
MLLSYVVEPDKIYTEKLIERVGLHKDAFLEKDYLYQLAMVMVCLVARERDDDRFAAIRKRFELEAIFFPMFHNNEVTQPSFMAAMREIANLEKSIPETKPFTWAREWFSGIGVEITNPVDLTLFVVGWQQRLFHMLKLFTEISKNH